MRSRSLVVGAIAGVACGACAVAALDAATPPAGAQGGFTVSAEQLQINQRISQAAVRRSNRSLNYLAPVRTQATEARDDGTEGVTPLAQVPGAGRGWTTSQLADSAVTSEKIAAGGVTGGDLADGAVSSPKIGAGAVGTAEVADHAIGQAQLDPGTASGLARFAHVTGGGALQGNRGFTSARVTPAGAYELTTADPVSTEDCAVQVTPDDDNPGFGYFGKYQIAGANTIIVRIYYWGDGTLDNEPFSVTVHCV